MSRRNLYVRSVDCLSRPVLALLPVFVILLLGGCRDESGPAQVQAVPPTDLKVGEAKFTANCARCHGAQAGGTKQGPPLVHKIYEPSHHGDAAFHRAVEQGVRAHHWKFGNMPRIEGVSREDVAQIIQYVRWLQREAGIH